MNWITLGVGMACILIGYAIGHRDRRRGYRGNARYARCYWLDECLFEKCNKPDATQGEKNGR